LLLKKRKGKVPTDAQDIPRCRRGKRGERSSRPIRQGPEKCASVEAGVKKGKKKQPTHRHEYDSSSMRGEKGEKKNNGGGVKARSPISPPFVGGERRKRGVPGGHWLGVGRKKGRGKRRCGSMLKKVSFRQYKRGGAGTNLSGLWEKGGKRKSSTLGNARQKLLKR